MSSKLQQIREIEAKIIVLNAEIKAIRHTCSHEREFDRSFLGSTSTYCPDCGRSD